jgi:prepilin-type N-terminal cleavage/methylation domain-containing protein
MGRALRRKAFTLLELIITIVVVSVLALVAVPLYKSVTDHARDGAARQTVAAIGRDASTLVSFQDGTTMTDALTTAITEAHNTPTTGAPTATSIAWAVNGTTGGLATLASPGKICYAHIPVGASVTTWCDAAGAVGAVGAANRAATNTGPAAPLAGPARAVWVWTQPDVATLVAFAAAHQVDELYVAVGWSTPAGPAATWYTTLRDQAHAAGLRVDALGGDPSWADPADDGWAVTDWTTRMAGTGLFDGVHLDIEPYIDATLWAPANQAATAAALTQALGSAAAAAGAAGGVPVSADVPFWYDQIDGGGGHTLLEQVVANTAGITVMAYRDTVTGGNGVLDLVGEELDAARAAGKQVRVGLETSDTGTDNLDFSAEGATALATAADQIDTALGGDPAYAGIAVHHYTSWSTMAP